MPQSNMYRELYWRNYFQDQGKIDHNKRDKNSHILKHFREEGHSHVWDKDFKVLNNNYQLSNGRLVKLHKIIKTII